MAWKIYIACIFKMFVLLKMMQISPFFSKQQLFDNSRLLPFCYFSLEIAPEATFHSLERE